MTTIDKLHTPTPMDREMAHRLAEQYERDDPESRYCVEYQSGTGAHARKYRLTTNGYYVAVYDEHERVFTLTGYV